LVGVLGNAPFCRPKWDCWGVVLLGSLWSCAWSLSLACGLFGRWSIVRHISTGPVVPLQCRGCVAEGRDELVVCVGVGLVVGFGCCIGGLDGVDVCHGTGLWGEGLSPWRFVGNGVYVVCWLGIACCSHWIEAGFIWWERAASIAQGLQIWVGSLGHGSGLSHEMAFAPRRGVGGLGYKHVG